MGWAPHRNQTAVPAAAGDQFAASRSNPVVVMLVVPNVNRALSVVTVTYGGAVNDPAGKVTGIVVNPPAGIVAGGCSEPDTVTGGPIQVRYRFHTDGGPVRQPEYHTR